MPDTSPSVVVESVPPTQAPLGGASASSHLEATEPAVSTTDITHGNKARLTTAEITPPSRQEQKIRNLDVTVGRYISTHALPLQHPPQCAQAMCGDLYIHHYATDKLQIWFWDGDQWEEDIADGSRHPTLPNYRLYVNGGGGPTWVTKKTRSTYQGRSRHQKGGASAGSDTPPLK